MIRQIRYVRELVEAAGADECELTTTERCVALLIASHVDHRTGESFPSVPTLARGAGVTPATVTRALRRLEAVGVIATQAGGGRWPNRYRFPLAAPVESAPDLSTPRALARAEEQYKSREKNAPRSAMPVASGATAPGGSSSRNRTAWPRAGPARGASGERPPVRGARRPGHGGGCCWGEVGGVSSVSLPDLLGMRCVCPPGCTVDRVGDGPRGCDARCGVCRVAAGCSYREIWRAPTSR